jgi:tetratricopeptide (TPR) repeat protein
VRQTQRPGSRNELVISSRYDVRALLARGGMGSVFQVYDRLLSREVALKRLYVSDEAARPKLNTLFEHEYQNLVHLSHPGIVQVFDYGVDREGPYYTMELLSGRDLSTQRPDSIKAACGIFREVASALALVHTRGLVHRDLTPSNVRLTAQGQAKLIDFGALAPFGLQRLVVGTPSFVAPECLDPKTLLDQRADLYALGALMYWVLTRRHAVHARSFAELRSAFESPVIPPSDLAPEIPGALEELILALLCHDPLARPATAAEVMDRLTSIAELPEEPDHRRVALSYLAHPPLVGREQLVERLLAPFSDGDPVGSAFSLVSNPGLGRSALLARLMLGARIAGAVVLHAEARVHKGAFGVARALVRSALFVLSDQLKRLIEQHAEVVHLCAPELMPEGYMAKAGNATAGAPERHARLVGSMQDVLVTLAERAPVCVVVDDVHRADQESQGLLASLANAAQNLPLSVYLSARAGAGWSDANAEAKYSEVAHRLVLAPLDEAQLVSLTQTVFGKVANTFHVGRFLHVSSGGVPLRAVELMRLFVHSEQIRYETGTFNLPHHIDRNVGKLDLDAAFTERIGAFSSEERQLCELLWLYDDSVSLVELLRLSTLEERALRETLEGLVNQGLVTAAGGRYSFTHDGVRALFERSISTARQREIHLHAARGLLALKNRTPDEAWQAGLHLMRGGEELRGARLLRDLTSELHTMTTGHGKLSQGLVRALTVLSEHGDSDKRCAPMLVMLCVAAYQDDSRLFAPYLKRAYEALLVLSGVALAGRLARFLPGKLSLVLGLLAARVRYALTPRRYTFAGFREMLQLLFAVAGAGVSAAIAAFDEQTARYIVDRLRPFGPLGSKSAAVIMRDFCGAVTTLQSGRHSEAYAAFVPLIARLESDHAKATLSEEVRLQLLIGVFYGLGFAASVRASPEVPLLADRMDGLGRAFFQPHAELLRFVHYGLRGELQRSESHRTRAELLSLRGASAWSAIHAMNYRQILISQWTRDGASLLRASNDLSRILDVAPGLRPFRDLAEAYLELLRGRPAQAVELYQRVFNTPRETKLANWCMERGRYAQALNALGRHGEAKEVCEEALAELSDADKPFRFMYQGTLQELALCEAHLGAPERGLARLDALLAMPVDNPLLTGALYRDKGRIAIIERNAPAFLAAFTSMSDSFRRTQHPALIQQCEQLWSEAARSGLVQRVSGDDQRTSLASRGSLRSSDTFPLSSVVDEVDETAAEPLDVTQDERLAR